MLSVNPYRRANFGIVGNLKPLAVRWANLALAPYRRANFGIVGNTVAGTTEVRVKKAVVKALPKG